MNPNPDPTKHSEIPVWNVRLESEVPLGGGSHHGKNRKL